MNKHPPPPTTLKRLSVDLRAKIHKYRGQIYGTKCKCDVLLFVKLEYNICGIYPPPPPNSFLNHDKRWSLNII